MKLYFDRRLGRPRLLLELGELYATRDDLVISTVLGSCVAVCLLDRQAGVAGMNHFLLPGAPGGRPPTSARYGEGAMRMLLDELCRLGASPARLVARVFGAARVLDVAPELAEANAAFALEWLSRAGIPVLQRDLGGTRARRLSFFTRSGRAQVQLIEAEGRSHRDKEVS